MRVRLVLIRNSINKVIHFRLREMQDGEERPKVSDKDLKKMVSDCGSVSCLTTWVRCVLIDHMHSVTRVMHFDARIAHTSASLRLNLVCDFVYFAFLHSAADMSIEF